MGGIVHGLAIRFGPAGKPHASGGPSEASFPHAHFLRRPDTASPQRSRLRLRFCRCAPSCCARCSPPARQSAGSWSGYAEGEYVFVASALAGTLARLDAQRGTWSRPARRCLRSTPAEQAGREEAVARLEAARAQAANATKGRRGDELAVVEAQLAQARTQAQLAENELARQQGLVTQGFVSPATWTKRRAPRPRRMHVSRNSPRPCASRDCRRAPTSRRQPWRRSRRPQQALAQSAWREEQKLARAPAARVAETYFRVGEWVAAGQPVVSLLPPAGVKARFFVPQADLGALAVGQTVRCAATVAAPRSPARDQLHRHARPSTRRR